MKEKLELPPLHNSLQSQIQGEETKTINVLFSCIATTSVLYDEAHINSLPQGTQCFENMPWVKEEKS
jgi:hypothetical protein